LKADSPVLHGRRLVKDTGKDDLNLKSLPAAGAVYWCDFPANARQREDNPAKNDEDA
jgi:hypothetical protein